MFSTPAERRRGCSWADHFESAALVVLNGGAVTGAPTFSPGGVVLDGSSDYITYNLTKQEFFSAKITIVCSFTPAGATSENALRTLYDTSDSHRYAAFKQNNAGSNTLDIYMGHVLIATIPEATYSPHWNVGSPNILVVSGTTGNTSAWLNGIKILNADATAWSAKTPAQLFVGCDYANANKFEGTIHKIQMFREQLSAAECIDICNNAVYAYRDSAVVNLPMSMEQHDPTNVRSLDISGNGHHGVFGDGSTPGTYPTKTDKNGYDFDGAAEYLAIADADDLSFGDGSTDSPFTVSMWIRGDILEDVPYINKSDAMGVNTEWVLMGAVSDAVSFVMVDNSEAACYVGRSLNPTEYLTYTGQWVHIVGVYDGTGGANQSASVKVYLNGVRRDNANLESNPGNYVAMEPLGADVLIGKSILMGPQWTDGKISKVQIFPQGLTPTQIFDLFLSEHRKLNKV